MPIKPENRWLYPIDWPQLSDVIRLERARGRCEGCGRPHGRLVCHLGDGRWWDDVALVWRSGRGRPLKLAPLSELPTGTEILTTHVVLACAYLDHLFLDIRQSSKWPKAIPQGGPLLREQTKDENAKLKRLVADLSLDRTMLQDVLRRKW